MRYIKSFENDAAIQAAVDNKSLGKPYVALNEQTGEIDWNGKEETDYSKMYLTIEALSGGTLNVKNANIGYSVNGGTWETSTQNMQLSINQGDAVRFRGTNYTNTDLFFNSPMRFKTYGNVESLEYGDDFIGKTVIGAQQKFQKLFRSCTGLTDASNLILPATTLQAKCYMSMFQGCTNLTTAPELPASYPMGFAYNSMFSGCTNLSYVKCLATTLTAVAAFENWLTGVASTGTFVKKAGVNWPTGASGIPSGWTVIEE